MICKYSLQVHSLSVHFFLDAFQEVLNFDEIQLNIFSSVDCAFGVTSKKSQDRKDFLLHFLLELWIPGFTFRSAIYLELIFVWSVKYKLGAFQHVYMQLLHSIC